MKVLKKTLFTIVAVMGLSLAASAQKHDPKRPTPPKDNPPVVTPEVKRPKEDRPKRPRSEVIPYRDEDLIKQA